jgi:hypothetical protein
MNNIKRIICLITFSIFHFSLSAQITGRNVTFVTAYKGTKAEGIFYQTGPKKWVESKGGLRVHAKFIETARDEWSVYLKDGARGIRVQLDLYTKKIKVNDEVFYTIGNVKAEKKNFNQNNTTRPTANTQITGRNATYVRISQNGRVIGAFKQTAPKQWTEYKGTRVHAKFTETGRDAWSVYLNDASRGIKAQINLHRKKVLVNNNPIYTTSNPSSRVSYTTPTTRPNVPKVIKTYTKTRFKNKGTTNTANNSKSRFGKAKNTRNLNSTKQTSTKKIVKGYNLKKASYGDEQFKYLGMFSQMDNSKNWYLQSRAGHTEDYFKETGRDEWSVYLQSTKSVKKVQIDLYKKTITVTSNGKKTTYRLNKAYAR